MAALDQQQEEARFAHDLVQAQSKTAPQSTGVRTADQPWDPFIAISNANKLFPCSKAELQTGLPPESSAGDKISIWG